MPRLSFHTGAHVHRLLLRRLLSRIPSHHHALQQLHWRMLHFTVPKSYTSSWGDVNQNADVQSGLPQLGFA
eukprot:2767778-Alexandrium_andersonii.AAC.1